MKTPIKPEDIRKGDLIRWERGGDSPPQAFVAAEYHAQFDGEARRNYDGQHYLLNRPSPKLPDTPTLGWAEWTPDWGRYLAVWEKRGKDLVPSADRPVTSGRINNEFLNFTEAVAVPKAALDELRDDRKRAARYTHDTVSRDAFMDAINDFLAAVDKANGSDR